MTISFNRIASNLRVPLFYAEFDNSAAQQGGVTQEYNTLLIGNRLSTGTVPAKTLQRVTSAEQAVAYFGAGSVLADMAAAHLRINKNHPLYCVGMADNGSGVAASGSVTFSVSSPAAGILNFLVGGRAINLGTATTSTGASLATAFAAAVNADTLCLVSAAVDGVDTAKVNLTAKNKGVHGNELDIRHSHYAGQMAPSGVTATIVAMASGAGNPDVDEVWPVIGDSQYILIATPWTDTVSIGKVQTQLDDRFGPDGLNDGYAVYGRRASFGTLATLGDSFNSQFSTILAANGPSNPWVQAAAATARIAQSASIDPARPFQTLVLTGIIAPSKSEQFTKDERNQLLYTGIATSKVNPNGEVELEGLITTFKENSFGSPDTSYLYLNTLLTLSYLRFDWAALITSRYPRSKLADDGTNFGVGQAIVTPSVIKAEAINKFKEWELKGLVEGFDQFKEELVVERNIDNPNRLDILMPPDLVNQFVVAATKIQFRL